MIGVLSLLKTFPLLLLLPRRSFIMQFSDLVPLGKGTFQLEKGYGQWNPEQCESVVILFAGAETGLTSMDFEDDDEVL